MEQDDNVQCRRTKSSTLFFLFFFYFKKGLAPSGIYVDKLRSGTHGNQYPIQSSGDPVYYHRAEFYRAFKHLLWISFIHGRLRLNFFFFALNSERCSQKSVSHNPKGSLIDIKHKGKGKSKRRGDAPNSEENGSTSDKEVTYRHCSMLPYMYLYKYSVWLRSISLHTYIHTYLSGATHVCSHVLNREQKKKVTCASC